MQRKKSDSSTNGATGVGTSSPTLTSPPANLPVAKPKPGSSFSAIIPSMLPADLYEKYMQSNYDEMDFVYDEFAFRVDKDETNKDQDKNSNNNNNENQFIDIRLNNNKKPSHLKQNMFLEDSKHKLKWVAYLEFTLNADMGSSFSWDQVTSLNRCEKLRAMIRGQGVPHSLRPFIWTRLNGALHKKQSSKFKYGDLFKSFAHDQYYTSKQIEKDLLRTLPTNACFTNLTSVGVPRLRRVLQSIAWLYPSIGYCQGMGTIAADRKSVV